MSGIIEDYEFRRDEWAYRENERNRETKRNEPKALQRGISGVAKATAKAETEVSGVCTICGGPEPCSKGACLDALSAQADYWEGTIEGSDWKYK